MIKSPCKSDFIFINHFLSEAIMDYAKMDKSVQLLDDKKDKCKTADGEFSATFSIPKDLRDDEKAKAFDFLFLKTKKGKIDDENPNAKVIDLVEYVQCSMIPKLDMETFHNSLTDDERFDVIFAQHKVNYRKEYLRPKFEEHMGYKKPSKINDKIKQAEAKITFSIRTNTIEALVKNGMKKKDAEKLFDEQIAHQG